MGIAKVMNVLHARYTTTETTAASQAHSLAYETRHGCPTVDHLAPITRLSPTLHRCTPLAASKAALAVERAQRSVASLANVELVDVVDVQAVLGRPPSARSSRIPECLVRVFVLLGLCRFATRNLALLGLAWGGRSGRRDIERFVCECRGVYYGYRLLLGGNLAAAVVVGGSVCRAGELSVR